MSYEPYTGRIYSYAGGIPAGVPWDVYQKFLRDKPIYDDLSIPYPRFLILVLEPNGTLWEYTFSYDAPFSFSSKFQVAEAGAPAAGYVPSVPGITPVKFRTIQQETPKGIIIPPDEPIPYEPEPDPTVIEPWTVILPEPEPEPTPTAAGGWGDIALVGAIAAAAMVIGYVFKK